MANDEKIYVDGIFDKLTVRSPNPLLLGMKRASYKLPPLGPVGDYPFAKNLSGDVFITLFVFNQNSFGTTEGEVTLKTTTATAGPTPVVFSSSSSVGSNSAVPRFQCGFGVQSSGSIFEVGELLWKHNETLYLRVSTGDATGVTGHIDVLYFPAKI